MLHKRTLGSNREIDDGVMCAIRVLSVIADTTGSLFLLYVFLHVGYGLVIAMYIISTQLLHLWLMPIELDELLIYLTVTFCVVVGVECQLDDSVCAEGVCMNGATCIDQVGAAYECR